MPGYHEGDRRRPRDEAVETLPKLTGKRALWLMHFIDADNPETFMNRTASAKAAKYAANSEASFQQIGSQNFRLLKGHIGAWLDEAGISPTALKIKLVEGLDAMKTVVATYEGKICDERQYIDYTARYHYLKLAMQCQGMLVEKKEVSGPGGKPVEHNVTGNVHDFAKALMDAVEAKQQAVDRTEHPYGKEAMDAQDKDE